MSKISIKNASEVDIYFLASPSSFSSGVERVTSNDEVIGSNPLRSRSNLTFCSYEYAEQISLVLGDISYGFGPHHHPWSDLLGEPRFSAVSQMLELTSHSLHGLLLPPSASNDETSHECARVARVSCQDSGLFWRFASDRKQTTIIRFIPARLPVQ